MTNSTSRRWSPCRPKPYANTPSGSACRVNLDYHVEIAKHYYSVPHQLDPPGGRSADHRRDRRDFSIAASALPVIDAALGRIGRRPSPSTCRVRTGVIAIWTHERIPAARPASVGDNTAILADVILRSAAAPGAGVPLLHRHPRPGQTLRHRARRRHALRPCAGARHALLQPSWSPTSILKNHRETAPAADRRGNDPDPREHSRSRLLPLTQDIERREDADPPHGRALARARPLGHGRGLYR